MAVAEMDRAQDGRSLGVTVVSVPFPAQGHLNQLLHFSLLLSSRGLSVHYATSAAHVRQVKSRLQGWSATSINNIQFHPLPLPHFSTPPPDPDSTTKFPSHLQPLFEATVELRSPFAALLRSLSSTARRVVVVHDAIMSFAGLEASSFSNAESYRFQCVPAAFSLSFLSSTIGHRSENRRPEFLDVIRAQFDGCYTREFYDFVIQHDFEVPAEAGTIINTCRPVEGEFIDLLADQPSFKDKKLFAIGSLSPIGGEDEEADDSRRRHDCLDWLDRQPPDSVVYVSFGTQSSLSDQQIEQLAAGLRSSGQRFIWVVRDADRGDIFAGGEEGSRQRELPPGFEEEVEGVGVVVTGWAPQPEILAHPSTGGFVSHCGWNSCMESLSSGVPILAWPMHSDQPRNAMMVAEYLDVGVMVREWARREETVSAAEIEEAIRRVMVEDGGKELRRRAKAMGETIRREALDGGSLQAELDAFVDHVSR